MRSNHLIRPTVFFLSRTRVQQLVLFCPLVNSVFPSNQARHVHFYRFFPPARTNSAYVKPFHSLGSRALVSIESHTDRMNASEFFSPGNSVSFKIALFSFWLYWEVRYKGNAYYSIVDRNASVFYGKICTYIKIHEAMSIGHFSLCVNKQEVDDRAAQRWSFTLICLSVHPASNNIGDFKMTCSWKLSGTKHWRVYMWCSIEDVLNYVLVNKLVYKGVKCNYFQQKNWIM